MLLVVSQKGYFDVVKILIKNGANVNATDKDDISALWIASRVWLFDFDFLRV